MIVAKKNNIQKGDLAVHSQEFSPVDDKSFKKLCIVLDINPKLGSGFKSVEIMWCDSGKVETVMINYLKVIQKL